MQKINIEIEISDELVEGVLMTAFDAHYGGSNYWITSIRLTGVDDAGTWTEVTITCEEPVKSPDALIAEMIEAGQDVLVNDRVIATGIHWILTDRIKISSDLAEQIKRGVANDDAGEIDAYAADCIVQAGLFGELIYG